VDEIDSTMIELFAEEPRLGVLEASRRLGIARGTVQARLDRLAAAGVIVVVWTAIIAFSIVRSTERSDPMRVFHGAP